MIPRIDIDFHPAMSGDEAQIGRIQAALASSPADDPNAVGRALGYEMGGGGFLGLVQTVATAASATASMAAPLAGVVAPELLPVIAAAKAGGMFAGALGPRSSAPGFVGFGSTDSYAGSSLPRALGVPIRVERQTYADASLPVAGARANSARVPRKLPKVKLPPDRVLRAWYRRAEADRRANEPGQRGISFATFKRLVKLQMQLAATDPGGNVRL